MKLKIFIINLLLCCTYFSYAQKKANTAPSKINKIDQSIINGLKFRNICAGKTGGRITKVIIDPNKKSRRFAAVASGNIWRTLNAGTTWEPVFDSYGAYAVGTIEFDPNNTNIIWAGTGENNAQRSVAKGDGIYKSVNGGDSWTNMGLKTSAHIGKIMIDPRNSDIVYVAAQGNVWKDGGERGLYKTIDGGKNWERILHITENTGISDIIFDPLNPDILLVSSYQRRRHVGKLVAGGPNGGIWKSTDAGKNWTKLKNGLPGGDLGRIGLAISPQKSNVVYALIAGTNDTKGFYRSENQGDYWKKMSDYMVIDAQYYMELFPDPHQFDKVYSVNLFTAFTEDGGKTFQRINERKKHVDSHDVVFDKDDPDYIMVSCDGGIYESWDRTKTWKFTDNIPLTQFYRVGIDNEKPFYNMYGGTQDNATIGVPVRTTNPAGIRNSDWYHIIGGDGFQTRVDPTDPNILYSQSQYGYLNRYNKQTNERVQIQPQPKSGEAPLRWHWNSPLLISPHQSNRLYFAANKLFKSEDGGNTWIEASGDLSRQEDRNKAKVMGEVWGIDAVFKNVWTSPYGTIVALDESPKQEGLIYAGTDDGLVQITEDGGQNWRKTSQFPTVPAYSFVADIHTSRHDANTVFVVFNNHKQGDFKPYILKSTDKGKTWNAISNNLPKGEYAWTIYQDHKVDNLLFAGTELGLYFSINGGQHWHKFKGGLPTMSYRDIEIQTEENDLVVASFGRGFYILEDYSPLRELTTNTLAKSTHLFPVKDALLFIEKNPDGRSLGHAFYTSPNPEFGAIFTYYLKDGVPTIKQARLKAEKAKRAKKEPVYYPEWTDFVAERRETKPQLVFSISNENGDIIRKITAPLKKGLHRVNWDLRQADGLGGAVALVQPGTYAVQLAKIIKGEWTDLGIAQSFEVVPLYPKNIAVADRQALQTFQQQVYDLGTSIRSTNQQLTQAIEQTKNMQKSILQHPKGQQAAYEKAQSLQNKLQDLEMVLNGNDLMVEKMELTPPSIAGRLNRIKWNFYNTTGLPMVADKENYQIALEDFENFKGKLAAVLGQKNGLEKDFKGLGIYFEE